MYSRGQSQHLPKRHYGHWSRWAGLTIRSGVHSRKYGEVLHRPGYVAECTDVSLGYDYRFGGLV